MPATSRSERSPQRRYRVYVIELDDLGPRRNPDLPWVYVGYSSKTPRQRFAQHRVGGRLASNVVTRHWVKRRPDLYGHLPAFRTRPEALQAERQLRQELLDKGYSVRGGTPGAFDPPVD